MKYPILAAIALVAIAGTAWLVAQNEDHALRLWLIDRIEQAYVDGDTERLRRMAESEYERDIEDWLDRQSAGVVSVSSASGDDETKFCPDGTIFVEKDGMCHAPPSTGPVSPPLPPIDLPDVPLDIPPPPPAPPVQVPTPTPAPTPLPKPRINPACLNAMQLVAQCWAEQAAICRIADEADADEEDLYALRQACSDKGVECTVKTVAAANLCAAG